MANNVLVTLDNIQLNVGFVTPIMEDTSLRTYYMDQGMVASLHEWAREIEVSMWIEKVWAPKLQLDNDGVIMERFAAIQGMTTCDL